MEPRLMRLGQAWRLLLVFVVRSVVPEALWGLETVRWERALWGLDSDGGMQQNVLWETHRTKTDGGGGLLLE